MLTAYFSTEQGLAPGPLPASVEIPSGRLVWIDLLSPTHEEEHAVQNLLDIEVPTREEMREIELSSRLYQENGAIYMTASIVVNGDGDNPETTEVTFILAQGRVVTVRYAEPRPFALYSSRACKPGTGLPCEKGEAVLIGLVDAIVDRLADLLERAGADIDGVSNTIFRRDQKRPMRSRQLNLLIRRIGAAADLNSRAGESLISLARLISFLSAPTGETKLDKEARSHLKTAQRDVNQLTDHASFLSNKITFLLDAVVGLISIEQNNIIKIFSVVSVALMPPTLIASIYGMNFEHMPELGVWWAYPVVLVVMLCSAVLPFLYFTRKGWL